MSGNLFLWLAGNGHDKFNRFKHCRQIFNPQVGPKRAASCSRKDDVTARVQVDLQLGLPVNHKVFKLAKIKTTFNSLQHNQRNIDVASLKAHAFHTFVFLVQSQNNASWFPDTNAVVELGLNSLQTSVFRISNTKKFAFEASFKPVSDAANC